MILIRQEQNKQTNKQTNATDRITSLAKALLSFNRGQHQQWYLSDLLSFSNVMVGLFFLSPHRLAMCLDWPGTILNTPACLFSQRMYWGLYVEDSRRQRMNFHRWGVFDSVNIINPASLSLSSSISSSSLSSSSSSSSSSRAAAVSVWWCSRINSGHVVNKTHNTSILNISTARQTKCKQDQAGICR